MSTYTHHLWRTKHLRATIEVKGRPYRIVVHEADDPFGPFGEGRVVDPREVDKEVLEHLSRQVHVIPKQVFGQPTAEPPRMAEFCLSLLLSNAHGDAAIGDLSERFEEDCRCYGPARARNIYLGRVLRSLWPLLRRAAARAIRWGLVAEIGRWFF